MGKKKKKVKDFPKVKLKIGKVLKKTTNTETKVSVKKIIINKQLEVYKDKSESKNSKAISHRGLNLEQLSRQICHYNSNVRKDAIIGIKQLLNDNPESIESCLYIVIPAIGRLVCNEQNNSETNSQLMVLIRLVLSTCSSCVLSPHFALLMAQIIRALTKFNPKTKKFGLSVLSFIMRHQQELCQKCDYLFDSLLVVFSGQFTLFDGELLLNVMRGLLDTFLIAERKKQTVHHMATISVNSQNYAPINIAPKAPRFDFSILGLSQKQFKSPMESRDNVLKLIKIYSAIIDHLVEKKICKTVEIIDLIMKLCKAVEYVKKNDPSANLKKEIATNANSLLSLKKRGTSKILCEALDRLLDVK